MKCSHGIQYESKCKSCADDALRYIRTRPQEPVLPATPAMLAEFWAAAFRQTVVQPKY